MRRTASRTARVSTAPARCMGSHISPHTIRPGPFGIESRGMPPAAPASAPAALRPDADPADLPRARRRHRRRRARQPHHPGLGPVLQPVQPALPAPDQDDHRAADLRDAGRRHRRRRARQGRRPHGPARDHLLRGRHDARAASSGCVAVNLMQARASAVLPSPIGQPPAISATRADVGPDPPAHRSRRRSSRRWPRATCCRSSSSHHLRASPSAMIGEKGAADGRVRASRSPRRCSSSRTSSCTTRRSASARRSPTPSATAASACSTTWRGWSARSTSRWRRSSCVVLLPVALIFRVPIRKFVKAVKEPAIDRVLDDVERGGAAARDGGDGAARRAAPRSSPSCCRSATASTSTARRSTCRWRRSSSRRPRACS